jgi:hypothetical protein
VEGARKGIGREYGGMKLVRVHLFANIEEAEACIVGGGVTGGKKGEHRVLRASEVCGSENERNCGRRRKKGSS